DPGHTWLAGDGPPVVLGVGSLTPRKDFPTLLRAFARSSNVESRLIILGEGPERATLESLAQELGISDRVRLPGFVANPFAYMARANVYVLSSTLEGLPGSLVQARACRCPSVGTDCPSGPAGILRDGEGGPRVPIGDREAMATAIDHGLADPLPAEDLRAAGQRYDAELVLDATHEYLLSFAGRLAKAA